MAFRERFAPEVSEAFAAGSKQILKDLRLGRRQADPQVIVDLLALYDAEIAANDAEFGTARRAAPGAGPVRQHPADPGLGPR